MMTELHAHLNSDASYVVCGIPNCGTRLAQVFRFTAEDREKAREIGDSDMDRIQFLPGWAPRRDGIWALSRYAKNRKSWGPTVKTRRYPTQDGAIPNAVMDSYYDRLPARAKCSECGFVNLLTPDELGVPLVLRVPPEPAPAGRTTATP